MTTRFDATPEELRALVEGVQLARDAILRRQAPVGFIDNAGEIVAEYRHNLEPFGPSLPGNAFVKWLLTHEWGGQRVTRVAITPNDGDRGFDELPPPADGTRYDPADCKVLAVAAAHPEHPPVLQSMDSAWWGWVEALRAAGVTIAGTRGGPRGGERPNPRI